MDQLPQKISCLFIDSIYINGIMCRLGIYAVICFSLFTELTYAELSPRAIMESHLNGDTILTAEPAQLIQALQSSISDNAVNASEFVYEILAEGRPDSSSLAPMIVTTAINSLPQSSSQIPQIVQLAVSATPDAALDIVKQAVLASSKQSAPAIVKSAISSLKSTNNSNSATTNNPQGLVQVEQMIQATLTANPSLTTNLTNTTQGTQSPTSNTNGVTWPPANNTLAVVSQ